MFEFLKKDVALIQGEIIVECVFALSPQVPRLLSLSEHVFLANERLLIGGSKRYHTPINFLVNK